MKLYTMDLLNKNIDAFIFLPSQVHSGSFPYLFQDPYMIGDRFWKKTEISCFFTLIDICARKWPNPAEFGEHPFTFFILRCQICKIFRKFCIFGKGRGMVQICTISRNFCIFAYVDCGNVDSGFLFRKVRVQICIISWTFCIFAPCHTPCQIYKNLWTFCIFDISR